jgi:hypothetical protein
MNAKKGLLTFLLVFSIVLLLGMGISYLWSLFFHAEAAINWETSFQLSLIMGIILGIVEGRRKQH